MTRVDMIEALESVLRSTRPDPATGAPGYMHAINYQQLRDLLEALKAERASLHYSSFCQSD